MLRARAVEIKFSMPWNAASIAVSCRKNIHLVDNRLPGGEAIGKVTNYTLSATGDSGDAHVEVTIGCTIGHGTTVTPVDGNGLYVEDGYAAPGYFATTGAMLDLGTTDVLYQSFDDIDVIDDDGLNLLDLRASDVVLDLSLTGGMGDQLAAINSAQPPDDPMSMLQAVPTVVSLTLKPVTGRTFATNFAPTISNLVVPKTIDLEAAS
jgi:hypothetical protein